MCEDSSCDSLTDPGDRLDLRDALTCDILSVTYGCDCTGCHCIYDPRPPIVGCLLVALLVALVVYCCCCKGKKAAAGAPAQPTAVEITKTAV